MGADPFLTLLRDLKNKDIDLGSITISEIRDRFYGAKYTSLSAIYIDWSGPECRHLLRRLIRMCPTAVADLGLIPIASIEERYPVIINAPILTLFRSAKYLTTEEICLIYDLAMSHQYHMSVYIAELLAVKILCRLALHCRISDSAFIKQVEETAKSRLYDLCADCGLVAVDYDFDNHNIIVLPVDTGNRAIVSGNIVTSVVFDGCITPAIWPLITEPYIPELTLLLHYSQFGHGIPPTFNKRVINRAVGYFLAAGDIKRALCSFLSSPCLVKHEHIIRLGQQLAASKSLLAPDYYAAYKNLAKQIVGDAALSVFSDSIDNKLVLSTCDNVFNDGS